MNGGDYLRGNTVLQPIVGVNENSIELIVAVSLPVMYLEK